MSLAKNHREKKRQLGQFLTPPEIAKAIVGQLSIRPEDKILEPSFGEGAFLLAVREQLARTCSPEEITRWSLSNVDGCELDERAYGVFLKAWGDPPPPGCVRRDFFRFRMPSYAKGDYFRQVTPCYDWVLGNPPFGGTFDADLQDDLDAIYGMRRGMKIKKETYAFFIVKSLDLLKEGGQLVFICSDTLLSIATMAGLRHYLMETCSVSVESIPGAFLETSQPMILLKATKGGRGVSVFGASLPEELIRATPNNSWLITPAMARYFAGPTIGDFLVATSGMTIGRNEYFLREIHEGHIVEPYDFAFDRRPITLKLRLEQARLGKLSARCRADIAQQESAGDTEPCLVITKRATPVTLPFPHSDYAPYNKATGALLYAPPTHAIYWKNQGEAVYLFKKTGPWYLHGVGGRRFFGREGLTWQLISSQLNIRYLPPGYILDSGAPCAFLRPGVKHDELFFIAAWCLTGTCNRILKTVINHTRNIQSKDFERLPYPFWVPLSTKAEIVQTIKNLLCRAQNGEIFTRSSPEIKKMEAWFYFPDSLPTEYEPHFSEKQSAEQMCFAF